MRDALSSTSELVRIGAVAGLAGGIAIDAYRLFVYVVLGHALTAQQFYQYDASGAIGPLAAHAEPSTAWLGFALHLIVSMGWGVGFAYVASRTPQVRAQPLVSGLVYGAVVMLAMWLIEFAAAIWQFPTVASFEHALVAHTVFFGVPVAYVVSRQLTRA